MTNAFLKYCPRTQLKNTLDVEQNLFKIIRNLIDSKAQ